MHLCSVAVDVNRCRSCSRAPVRHVNNVFIISRVLLGLSTNQLIKKIFVDVVTAITSFFADLMPYLAGWRAAKIIHAVLLDNVLKTPLQFFEVTPVGRILSRFSKDVDVLDTSLPSQFADVIYCTFEVISSEKNETCF